MKKSYRILIAAAVILLVVYNAVTIQNLSTYKQANRITAFDAGEFAVNYWQSTVLTGLEKAIALDSLIIKLQKEKEDTFHQYGNSISIGSIGYFLIRTRGIVGSIEEDSIEIEFNNGNSVEKLSLAVEYIYGNAARDAFGEIDLNEFESTRDLNRVSEELNLIIKSNVVSPFLEKVRKGDQVEITGVIELNSKFLTFKNLEVIPLRLSFLP